MAEQFIYILLSKSAPKTYTGVSCDPIKRLREHNTGSNNYTKRYKPWELFYTESFNTRHEALARERYLKSHAGRKFIKKLIENK